MPRFELPYGGERLELEIPERNLLGVLEGRAMPKVDLAAAFDQAWAHPYGTNDPAAAFHGGGRVVIVVTDHTRPTPTRDLFPLLWERLSSVVQKEDVTFLVGTGTHRDPTDDELDRMFGPLRQDFPIRIHDSDRDLVEVGRSARGTPILVNRIVAEADHVVSLGHIGMHYFAGYTGGRKSILPGVAGRETISANHAMLLGDGARACQYQGNPINDEMVEAAGMVRHSLLVDVVLDPDGDVARVFLGNVEEAHAAGRAFWDEHFKVPLAQRADIVVASAGGRPKDINLYQAYKGVYNAARAVRDGGHVVLAGACPNGIGHPIFEDWLRRSRIPADVLAILEREGFRLGGHKAIYLARDAQRIHLHLRSELTEEETRMGFFELVDELDDAVQGLVRRLGDDARILVMPHAANAFPVVE